MTNENETIDSLNDETTTEVEPAEDLENLDAVALKEKLLVEQKAKADIAAKNRQLFERAKRAEGFEFDKDSKRWYKPEKPVPSSPESKVAPQNATGELDETQLEVLDLRGISETEDIEVIQKVMAKTGQTLRQVLKDDYVVSTLKAQKDARAVQNAMPGNSKRSGGATQGFDAALAKFDATGELPSDFALRSAVINAKVDRESATTPPWHRK